METKQLPLSQVYEKRGNPRIISDRNFQKLIDSILVFPKMMELRPVVIDDTNSSLGGNMRLRALNTIAQMSYEKIKKRLSGIKDYSDKTDKERKQIRDYWQKWLEAPYVETLDAADLTEDERKQFIIKDNVSMGEWDWQELMQNWDTNTLETWGVDAQLPDFGEGENPFEQGGGANLSERKITETEKLSTIEFVDAYYQPKEMPNINLRDCIDTDLFDKKMEYVESTSLPKEVKEVMRMLAYRFIRIDFEAVANYYAFNASEEEKRAIERLRCVLVDGSIDGFIGDRLLRAHEHFAAQATEIEDENIDDDGEDD